MLKLIAKLDENQINPETWEDYQQRKDKFLIRFLKANKCDVDKTYDMFAKFVISFDSMRWWVCEHFELY